MILKWIGGLGTALVAMAVACTAHAQGLPPAPVGAAPNQNQVCIRLESQLATIDRGSADPARAEQIKQYEDAANKQQFELDRVVALARKSGCEGSGFFLFGGQPPQCTDLTGQIQRLRAGLDRITTDLQRLQGGGIDRAEQRRAVLGALAQNDCGPQYRNVVETRKPNFFESLFGGFGRPAPPRPDLGPGIVEGNPDLTQSSTYRTLCVRTCDGYYFPISFSTVPSKFQDDERVCQNLCPASEVMLFSHRNPGEDVAQAVSLSGRRYSELPNAFHYRQEYSPVCSCRRPGQSWADALGQRDSTVERGDIIVTDPKVKASQPKGDPGKSSRQGAQSTNAPSDGAAAPTAPDNPAGSSEKRVIRSIGPQLLQTR